jgi:hypothetical protein
MSGRGFGDLIGDADIEYASSGDEFRQRYLLKAFRG